MKIPSWLERLILIVTFLLVVIICIKWFNASEEKKMQSRRQEEYKQRTANDVNILSLHNHTAIQLGNTLIVNLNPSDWHKITNAYSKAITNVNLIFNKTP